MNRILKFKRKNKQIHEKDPCIDCKRKQFMCLCREKIKWDNENLSLPPKTVLDVIVKY
jgi:hypothetical protein